MPFSNLERNRLYQLLPAYIRERDSQTGGALRGLLDVIDGQADLVEEDIRQLQQDAFVETAEPWVLPYIGDLVGTTPLFDESHVKDGDAAVELFPDLVGAEDRRIKALNGREGRSLPGRGLRPFVALRSRADVAKTIYYRRRKGTLPMLEELARDVTGWPCHAVEYFELLGWTQWLRNHLRLHSLETPDLRSVENIDRLNGAFDDMAHTVDVRRIGQDEGWYNIRNVGFHFYRLQAFGLERTRARRLGAAGDFRYFFSPLGQSAPLFSRARREGDEAGLATELHVPYPIRPAKFYSGIGGFYGNPKEQPSICVFVNGVEVKLVDVISHDLSVWAQPTGSRISIDVKLGRLAIGPGLAPVQDVEVSCHYGFAAHLGGGPYSRRAWLIRRNFAKAGVDVLNVGGAGGFATLAAAFAAWVAAGKPYAIIRIQDNRTYDEAVAIDASGALGNGLAIEAGDGRRPHLKLQGALTMSGDAPDFTLTLSGLLIEGQVVIDGSLRAVRLLHTTLVPGLSIAEGAAVAVQPGLIANATMPSGAQANLKLKVQIAFSICGAIRLPVHSAGLQILDSIIDGAGLDAVSAQGAAGRYGPALHVERVTLRGKVFARQIDVATEVIFDGLLQTERTQVGCIRFSYVPPKSRAPRRYRCQPELADRKAIEGETLRLGPLTPVQKQRIRDVVHARVKPEYSAEAYGQPGYMQLFLHGPQEIATGSADGAEMGCFCHLKQPQREANLHIRLKEYLPFGLDYGLIFVT